MQGPLPAGFDAEGAEEAAGEPPLVQVRNTFDRTNHDYRAAPTGCPGALMSLAIDTSGPGTKVPPGLPQEERSKGYKRT